MTSQRTAEIGRVSMVSMFCMTLGACVLQQMPPGKVSGAPGAHSITPPALEADADSARARMNFNSSMSSTRLPEPELVITPEVQRELDRFLARDRQSIVEGLRRRDAHYHTMSRIFSEYGVPLDLLNVAMIESGFQSEARSNVGAVGIWQFMKSTARVYGLKVGSAEDQRKDPVLSSVAAARHLRDLYLKYNDWNLALAAYNAGCGSLARSMRGTQKSDFWSLARRGSLRGQTARFVPRFIATAIIARNLKHYGFESEIETSLAKNSIDERYASRTTANWSGNRRTPIG